MPLISEKTRKFISGRCGQMRRVREACAGQKNIVWVHASSYGEFEEARPVISRIRESYPEVKVLATFFSPSGYEFLKNDPIADWVFYLPLDTRVNARLFVNAVKPIKVIISISDYWLNFLNELRRQHIDTYLISGRFVPQMFYFSPLGFIYRNTFRKCFTKMLVKDKLSVELLKGIGIEHVEQTGDPRMDRVADIAATPWSDPIIDRWTGGQKVFVGGSTLPDEDDEIMIALANAHPERKLLIVPHEQGKKQIDHLRESIKGKSVLYTEAGEGFEDAQVLIVNTVGMLSKIYRYGWAAYVGSGFEDSPHSVIEAAVYGCPVSYGPHFSDHDHCRYLADCGGGKPVHDIQEFLDWHDRLLSEPAFLEASSKAAQGYCTAYKNVADTIVKSIME